MLMRKLQVKKDERALLFKRGDFEAVLGAGEHTYFDPLKQLTVEKFTLREPRFDHRLVEYLMNAEPEVVAREFQRVELGPQEIGLRYENGALADVLAPNTRRLYWKGYIDVRIDRLNIADDFAVAPALVSQLVAPDGRGGFSAKVTGASLVYGVMVPQHQVAVLYVDGKVYGLLAAGMHAYWRAGREIRADIVDLRMQVLEVAGQEILTRDKVALRVNLTAGYRISDVLTAYARQAKPVDYLYKELQFGLRAAVGTRTLDELLEDKGALDATVNAHIQRRVAGFGLEVESVGVKDIILPGEMKVLLAKVVEAEKAAQANVIRRREETAATRSLLNTAKVMEDSPIALRLKELESLEKITEKIGRISVYGGLDGVLKELVKIR
ncbi:MAG TPA: slipin family protein [Burkholderiales bacterium]|jgi:regulator of protease activity HflC (stomatin/prohibitin superfamily)